MLHSLKEGKRKMRLERKRTRCPTLPKVPILTSWTIYYWTGECVLEKNYPIIEENECFTLYNIHTVGSSFLPFYIVFQTFWKSFYHAMRVWAVFCLDIWYCSLYGWVEWFSTFFDFFKPTQYTCLYEKHCYAWTKQIKLKKLVI